MRSFLSRGGTHHSAQGISPDAVAKLLGKPTGDQLRQDEREKEIKKNIEIERQITEAARLRKLKGIPMTVSLYKSTAGGTHEIVVQTNAQSLDVFISGLSDALDSAVKLEPEHAAQTISCTLRNAIPIAFAIAGYKADKVSESKLMTCGFASPDASELVAQSKV